MLTQFHLKAISATADIAAASSVQGKPDKTK